MPRGRNSSYNSRTGTWTKPKPWYEHKKGGKKNKNGCYVATAVYGSYDCPQVWVLRRFRDFNLAQIWYGRMFIKVYYSISPTIVDLFGGKIWFNKAWRGILDKKVENLKLQGFKDTPYNDIY